MDDSSRFLLANSALNTAKNACGVSGEKAFVTSLQTLGAALDPPLYVRDFSHLEYEIKLEIDDQRNDPLPLLLETERGFDDTGIYVIQDRVRIETTMRPLYYLDGEMELSVFVYESNRLMKSKRHSQRVVNDLPIMVSHESFEADPELINKRLMLPTVQEIGGLLKRRAKNFLIDLNDGRIYSVAVTVCTAPSGSLQRQLEIEYGGHVVDVGSRSSENEEEILERLSLLTRGLLQTFPQWLTPTFERKFDFLNRSLSEAANADNNKEFHA